MSIISESEMSERPTPETDAVAAYEGNWDKKALRMTAHSRKLERERDEAREEVELRKDSVIKAAAEIDRLKAQKTHWFEKAKKENELWLKAQEELNSLTRERDEAREALDRIVRPVWWMQEDQKRKTGSINGISGGMALALSENAEHLKGIARSALKGKTK